MRRAVIASPSDVGSATVEDARTAGASSVGQGHAGTIGTASTAESLQGSSLRRGRVDTPDGVTESAEAPGAGNAGPRPDLALVGTAAFDRCLKRPPLVRSGAFALHIARADPVTGPTDAVASAAPEPVWRLGLVIPKRYEASAVARNTIKRRWRGAFREGRVAWADEFGGAEVVVRMHAPLVKKADREATPAKVRARSLFDPQGAFVALAERLRTRSGGGGQAGSRSVSRPQPAP